LRDRPADILPLALAFLAKYSSTMGLAGLQFSKAAETALQSYSWPGNVRELENAVQRALLLCDGRLIEPEHIELDPTGMTEAVVPVQTNAGLPQEILKGGTEIANSAQAQDIESIERDHILKVLAQVGGNRKDAVAILGLSERALRYKLKAYKEAGFEFD